MTYDELLKLKAAVLYVVNTCEGIDYYHLFKILYFADREHLAKYGRHIISDTFCAMDNGPVPSNLYDAIKDVTGKKRLHSHSKLKIISDSLAKADSMYDYILIGREQADMDELSASDIEMLDKSIKENLTIRFGDLSNKSHDIAWVNAHDKKNASRIDDLLMAKAGGANDAMIDFIKELKSYNEVSR